MQLTVRKLRIIAHGAFENVISPTTSSRVTCNTVAISPRTIIVTIRLDYAIFAPAKFALRSIAYTKEIPDFNSEFNTIPYPYHNPKPNLKLIATQALTLYL